MNDLTIINQNGKLVTDSREVAEMIGKQHAHLLRDIKGYKEVIDQNPNLDSANFFIESDYEASTGQKYSCYLLTRKGCDMVANKLTGRKGVLFTAEYVTKFEEMEKKLKGPQLKGNSLDAIRLVNNQVGMLVGTVEEIQDRVITLENTMTIDYGQQLILQEMAKYKAIEAMSGKDSPAYKNKSLRSQVFSAVWKDYKDYFQVNSYKNTAKKEYDKAREYLKNWKPQGKILREIEDCNNQVSMSEKEAAVTC
ncbi:ORF6C domain-containing protein [Clostridium sp. JN-9]|uniref:ORF6C domain-containing protein n=1 Tax=Clostridium sp. JN-9 TaxID=2507159 RepID=UPI000FFE2FFF|nr:ORF6C domain-containing protein [Clostridium sp. JN-9]QAT40850.1 phage regulatory protein [Clostridium sp. JN-9]